MVNKEILFKCPLEYLTVYNPLIDRIDLFDCFACRFSSEDYANKLEKSRRDVFYVDELKSLCNCPPVMDLDLYEDIVKGYAKEKDISLFQMEGFNKKEFQKFTSNYINFIAELEKRGLDKLFNNKRRFKSCVSQFADNPLFSLDESYGEEAITSYVEFWANNPKSPGKKDYYEFVKNKLLSYINKSATVL